MLIRVASTSFLVFTAFNAHYLLIHVHSNLNSRNSNFIQFIIKYNLVNNLLQFLPNDDSIRVDENSSDSEDEPLPSIKILGLADLQDNIHFWNIQKKECLIFNVILKQDMKNWYRKWSWQMDTYGTKNLIHNCVILIIDSIHEHKIC